MALRISASKLSPEERLAKAEWEVDRLKKRALTVGLGGEVNIKVFQDTSGLSTGDGKFIFAIPEDLNGLHLVDAQAYITMVSTSSNPTIQIRNQTTTHDMLSTPITIKVGELTSYGPGSTATPSVVNPTYQTVTAGDLIAIDVDTAGTGAQGLGVILRFDSDPEGTGAIGPPGATGSTGATGANGTNGTNGLGVPAGGATGQVLTKNSGTSNDTSWQTPSGGGGSQSYAHLQHTRASGTHGGNSATTTWTTVPITGITTDAASLIGSLSSNQFTLAAGTYRIQATQAIANATQCKIRLRNITDSTTPVVGMTLYGASGGAIPPITLDGTFTITGTKTFAIQHYAVLGVATFGLGLAASSGEIEVYLNAMIFKQ